MKFYKPPGRSRQSASKPEKPQWVQIDGISHDLRGIARFEGKPLFVDNALPGEKVLAKVERSHGRFIEARAIEIETPSAQRHSARCQHFGRCGGCSLQYLKEQAQLEFKQQAVLEQLQRTAQVQPTQLEPPLASAPFGYRSRARLAVYYHRKQKQLRVGFRAARSKEVIHLKQCPVLAPELEALISPLQSLIDGMEGRDWISHLDLLLGDQGPAVVLRHIRPLSEEDLQQCLGFADTHLQQLFLQPGDRDSVHCIWQQDDNAQLEYRLSPFELRLNYEPLDFTQVNRQLNNAMVSQAMDWLSFEQGESVLDLFCGLGNFSLPAARAGARVTGIEGSADMVLRAEKNARSAGMIDARFDTLDLTQPGKLAAICREGIDKVILDPPRNGAVEIIRDVCQLQPVSILYISCNPATLARDAGHLRDQGYQLERLSVMDMFPQTGHIESMALFVQSGQ
ncbi:23S rRNA (uracil(1939)-C(5))-methyltransferase RlmD [Aestuariirhabdus sp. Z084]|uniref:23S rRNA (uracil(1939)-C(5))-methyltransferase RlmD n=1 Tax=Aestuariirhabdus haliotis TaxID=2918751 RepID=UPI00201B422D|nr:23S rRNA (uracil(1939)-C(5))-methyltransferase RlmD [Aestuariirhabdus haliotis]MCL6417143.1 23S rRNA (uracil(1939)-C(5))-methyltransferase RlmD [Aestuariirhabdus haliotis]MCL6421125.1 23S rRNA (uracil(1939)-C(5))-methyltransferase RlmD [Aestuariirhabdus haliotis]